MQYQSFRLSDCEWEKQPPKLLTDEQKEAILQKVRQRYEFVEPLKP